MDLMKLISILLQADPANRPTVEQALNHEWFQGPTAEPEEVFLEFQKRFAQMNKLDVCGEPGEIVKPD